MTPELEREILSRRWFYRFVLPDGRETPCVLPPEVEAIHETRRAMVLGVLDRELEGHWGGVEALDMACHQGWFSHHLAARGCRRVLGIDVRPRHIEDASLITGALGIANVAFRVGDVTRLDVGEVGTFDVVLVLGLVYHLENPIAALRLARACTRRVCVIESQVAPGITGALDWGTSSVSKPFAGTFAVVDESGEVAAGNPEANVSALSLVPSREALLYVLRAVGFARAEVVPPPAGAYEQLASGKRVVVAAWVDSA